MLSLRHISTTVNILNHCKLEYASSCGELLQRLTDSLTNKIQSF